MSPKMKLTFALAVFLAGCASPEGQGLPTAVDGGAGLTAGRVRETGIVIPFAADVAAIGPKSKPCANGAFICGTATIDGFGSAEYSLFLLARGVAEEPCIGPNGPSLAGSYTATVTFMLADGSTLTLDEEGTVCGPGFSLTAPGGLVSFGNPVDGEGAWRVREATGQFAGIVGDGTSTFRSVGAVFRATYVSDAAAGSGQAARP